MREESDTFGLRTNLKDRLGFRSLVLLATVVLVVATVSVIRRSELDHEATSQKGISRAFLSQAGLAKNDVGGDGKRGAATRKCVRSLQSALFMTSKGKIEDGLTLVDVDAKIHAVGAASVSVHRRAEWSDDLKDRMEHLRRASGRVKKEFYESRKSATAGGASTIVTLGHDALVVDAAGEACTLKGIYLGAGGGGDGSTYHPEIAEELSGAKPDQVVAQLTCGDHHIGSLGSNGATATFEVTVYSPVKELKLTLCNKYAAIQTGLKLFDGSGVKVSGSEWCDGRPWAKKIVIDDVLSTSSSPVAMHTTYEAVVERKQKLFGNGYRLNVKCKCANIRRDWASLADVEKQVYVDGVRGLRDNGKLEVLVSTHTSSNNANQAHGTSGFLPWHRYYLYEFERQIRNLGGQQYCFALSYWDWTRYNTDPSTDPLWDAANIGGDGTSGSDECVTTGDFTRSAGYYTPNMCSTGDGDTSGDVTDGTCCLKRNFGSSVLATAQSAVAIVLNSATFTSFRPDVEGNSGMHNNAHCFIRGHMCTYFSPDDPVFWMLHGFIDFLWAVWEDCYDYDKVAEDAVTSTQYSATGQSADAGLDDAMSYNVLEDETWARVNSVTVSPREVQLINGGTFLDYTYDEDDLISRSSLDTSTCTFDWVSRVASDAIVWPDNGNPKNAPMTEKVNGDIKQKAAQIKQANPNISPAEFNRQLADEACHEARKLAEEAGVVPHCEFDANYEKCGDGPRHFSITKEELLNKQGVKGNACLTEVRERFYVWAMEMGELRALCNGGFDPTCLVTAER